MSNQMSVKHRATEPIAAVERVETAGSHRGGRSTDLPIAAALGLILLVVAAILAVRH
ncbi:MAG: hypothetical protein FWE71_04245 [Nocardioidaceae bacterium]|nr:hypothetical protein [Nocardioidaceae bacterium]MCL2612974.1 hypothetical protein [Nocardioidaceae bacterium]